MIYLSFGSLLFVILVLAFVIRQVLGENSELTDKLMSRDFQQYAAIKRLDEKLISKPISKEEGKAKILTDIQAPKVRYDLYLGEVNVE